MNEFEIINKYFSPLSLKNKGSFKLQDDIFFDYKKKLAISIDTYIEKKHFLNFKHPNLVIKKIFRSALSDLICKGAIPKYYFISASGNKANFSKKKLAMIYKALKKEQKKFKMTLSGGDTTYSTILSFTFVVVGYSSKTPILRSDAKINDDIYVTGNLGDSYIGLRILQNKIKVSQKDKLYFINEYYNPRLNILFSKKINLFANSCIDISDGLYQDLNHIIKKKLDFFINISRIPISKKLKLLLIKKKISKKSVISRGDDYQILFTSHKKYRQLIKQISTLNHTKVTRIGIIKSIKKKRSRNNVKNIGYIHKF